MPLCDTFVDGEDANLVHGDPLTVEAVLERHAAALRTDAEVHVRVRCRVDRKPKRKQKLCVISGDT